MRSPGTILNALLVSAAIGLGAETVPFAAPHDIAAGTVSGVSALDAGPLDGDALPDVVVADGGVHAGGRRTFAWFRAPSVPGTAWTRHDLAPGAPLHRFIGALRVADLDGDGDHDIALATDHHSGTTKAADILVFVNPGGAASGTWTWHRCNPAPLALHHINDMEIADIDSDGRPDIIVRSLNPNQIHVFFQDGIAAWTRRSLDTGIDKSEGLAVGDLDGDGRIDLTFTGWWYRTPADARGGAYAKLPIDPGYATVNQNTKEAIGDIDGDGYPDVVIAPAEAYRGGNPHVLAWYRNPGAGFAAAWQRHVIEAGANDMHTVKLGDLDGDGDLDVVVGQPWNTVRIRIFANDGRGGFADVQTVATGKGLYSGVLVDIGADGDLDIVGQSGYSGSSKPWLYENQRPAVPPPVDVTAPTAPGALTVSAITTDAITLAWVAASDDVGVTAYEVQRDGAQVAVVTTTGWRDGGLAPSTMYRYEVRARDAAGNRSLPATVTATTTVVPAPPGDPAGTWHLALHGSDFVLTAMGVANYADVQARSLEGSAAQVWTIRGGTSTGWYEIVNAGSGKALECWARTPAEGDEITLYSLNRRDWQQWRLTPQADGSWRIEGRYNPRSVTAGAVAGGANVDARTDSGAATQRWELLPTMPSGSG